MLAADLKMMMLFELELYLNGKLKMKDAFQRINVRSGKQIYTRININPYLRYFFLLNSDLSLEF